MPVLGSIMYLPAWDDLAPTTREGWDASINPTRGAFGHPVVLLDADGESGQGRILIITSFGGKRLRDKGKRARARHLPIHPSEPHPDTGQILQLQPGHAMDKLSYVKIKPVYLIQTSDLDTFGRLPDIALTQSSYNLLVKASCVIPTQASSQRARSSPSPPLFSRSSYGTIQAMARQSIVEPTRARPPVRTIVYPPGQVYYGYTHGLYRSTQATPLLPQVQPRRQDQGQRFGIIPRLSMKGCLKALRLIFFCILLFSAFYGVYRACTGALWYMRALGRALTSLLEGIKGKLRLLGKWKW
ncbi:hypothetical protein CC79DRAFT_3531 [Sarocladium strictum]